MATEIEEDVYREVANIGGGNAATAMSELLMSRVHMGLPRAHEGDLRSVVDEATGGQEVTAVIVPTEGQLQGSLLFVYPSPDAYAPVLGCDGEMLLSAFGEISNILGARFLISLNQLLEVFSEVQPPQVHSADADGAYALAAAVASGGDTTVLRTQLRIDGTSAHAEMLFLPSPVTLELLRTVV